MPETPSVIQGVRRLHSGCIRTLRTRIEAPSEEHRGSVERYRYELRVAFPGALERALREERRDIARELLKIMDLGVVEDSPEVRAQLEPLANFLPQPQQRSAHER